MIRLTVGGTAFVMVVMVERIDCAKASPEGSKAFARFFTAVEKSGLANEVVALVYLRVSQLNGCAESIDLYSGDLLKNGLTVEKLGQVPVWRKAGPLFNARERSALAWAETVTRVAETGIPDPDYEAVAAEFSEKELAELTYAIVLMNASNRLRIAFRTRPAVAAKG